MCDCDNGIIEDICGVCSGSGEGSYDGSTCYKCKGKGVEHLVCEDCDKGAEVYIYERDALDYL